MVASLTILLGEIARLRDEGGSSERSYYHFLQNFLKAQNDKLELPDISSVAEESAGGEIGFPDITVRSGGRIIGWIEVKLPDSDLNHRNFKNQFVKYKDNLENIVFTNFHQWQLWQWNDKNKAVMVSEVSMDMNRPTKAQRDSLDALLAKFFVDYHTRQAKTPRQLAIALARKTKLLSQQALENFDNFTELKEVFSKVLIQDLDNRQFANLIAETLTYSLFLAMLESPNVSGGRGGGELTLGNVIDFLPPNIPILRDLYDLFRRVARDIKPIGESTDAVLDELKSADLESIHGELARHKPDEDPVVNFYEPFLNEYDPQARKSRGVYYTPKPVVDFIVDSVDTLLQNKFGKKDGIADNTVSLLDPATGTGTFLMSAIQKVHQRVCAQYASLGVEKEKWTETVQTHILHNFYGFELMVAPYAIAHLKLTLELERLGFRFAAGDKMRLQVLLANALDDPSTQPKKFSFMGLDSIPEESEAAREVKNHTPILAIIGNPPYANFGKMNKQPWILNLLENYKTGLKEKKVNLYDDYIKFIRFAQWKLEKCGQGIFAMITANSFLDGITHRQMRESLLNTFDEIYIYDLHGNSRKGEICPDGSPDQNVFEIQTGVSINIFVKLPDNNGQRCRVYSADAWGDRQNKFGLLRENNFEQTAWREIDYDNFNKTFLSTKWGTSLGKLNFFIPQNSSDFIQEYGAYWGVTDIFKKYSTGIETGQDALAVQFETEQLEEIVKSFLTLDGETLKSKYNFTDCSTWAAKWAMKDIRENSYEIATLKYRPFDNRKTVFSGQSCGFLFRPRADIMKNMLKPNLGMITCRNQVADSAVFCSDTITDSRVYSRPGSIGKDYMLPLYFYPERDKFIDAGRRPNINPDFISEMTGRLGVATLTAEAIFYYAYAVFYCPAYRERYAELLKIDFPRLPLISDKSLFEKLVAHGNTLVNLHLLGENPFDETAKELFADTTKWGVNFGGKPPKNVAPGQIIKVIHSESRVYINGGEYFEGITPNTWSVTIGGYQVLDKWLKDRKKADRVLTLDDKIHYMKIAVALRQTQKIMKELAALIPTFPPI